MPELNDNDLRKLFRKAGRPEPGIDLTDRIMARVAVTPIHEPLEVKPLIGRTGWILIAFIVIAIVSLLINTYFTGTAVNEPSVLDPLWRSLPDLRIRIPFGQWTIWTAAAGALILLCTLMDKVLEKAVK
jgi:hypothetical protein